MKTEQLLSKWHRLPEDKQQEVIDFVEFLESRLSNSSVFSSLPTQTPSKMGEKLQEIRHKIVASGEPLLSPEEVEKEKLERRGGYQGN